MEESNIIVITGANTGIGLETVKSLLRSSQKYHILLGGRNFEKSRLAAESSTSEATSQSSVEPFEVDVESDESIQRAYEAIAAKHPRIDCLVNNAGSSSSTYSLSAKSGASFDAYIQDGSMTARQAWNKAWDVNVTGAHIMTSTFLPLLLRSRDPRLVFLTSGLSSLQGASDPSNPRNIHPPAGLPKTQLFAGYRSSKAGLNMMMVEWAKTLKNDGVKVWAVAPGLLATSLGGDTELLRKLGAQEPSVGGDIIRGVIEGKRDADVGNVVREYLTPIQPW
ncbi:Short-chain dehydrogenase/reductase tropE [Lachnellula cervina]|uniref:Short-chain dehydrogenase/reductase tropE n=1 Tax=Lachnellula cervina TaxID=1316786 RepID=A0A7D8YS76_9HELO|nr:Short-chain dehydrogenase/reductase tropE [Lachnellula cervina]